MRTIDINEIDIDKLLGYGFKKDNNKYIYSKRINNDEFNVEVIYKDNKLISRIIDLDTNYEYTLVDNSKSNGIFVNNIREEYEKILDDIKGKVLDISPFHSDNLKKIVGYIKEKYDSDLEYLWEKFKDVAIWRNKDNEKWFGLIMPLEKNKLGLDGDEKIETITLKYQKDENDNIIDNKRIFKGYHMNKRSWITINLDSDIDLKKVMDLIDNSYELSR